MHYHQFLYERSISLQSLVYIDINRNFCWCALRSISLPEKHNSSKPVLYWSCMRLLQVCISINFFTREAQLFRACSILMLIGTFAGVHYHQFLYQRNITLQNLFYTDLAWDFYRCAFLSISLREKHNSSEPVLSWCSHGLLLVCITINFFNREAYLLRDSTLLILIGAFAGVHYHQFLYQRSISLKSLPYFDVNRDSCSYALVSILLQAKHSSSESVLFWCYHELLLVCIIINFFTREAYLLRACSIMILIGTFAGVHYHQFLYERNITLQNMFYIDVTTNFCWSTFRSISLR